MGLNERFKINTLKIVHQTIDGEVIIINFENGIYYSLNATGTNIWSCTERNDTIAEIVKEIMNKYEGNQEVIEKDINQFIIDLEKEELIVLNKENENKNSQESKEKSETSKEKPKYEKPELIKYTDMKEMLLLDPIHEVDETGWPASKTASKTTAKKQD